MTTDTLPAMPNVLEKFTSMRQIASRAFKKAGERPNLLVLAAGSFARSLGQEMSLRSGMNNWHGFDPSAEISTVIKMQDNVPPTSPVYGELDQQRERLIRHSPLASRTYKLLKVYV